MFRDLYKIHISFLFPCLSLTGFMFQGNEGGQGFPGSGKEA